MSSNFEFLGHGLQIVDRDIFFHELSGRLRAMKFPEEILNTNRAEITRHSDDLWYLMNDMFRRAPGAFEQCLYIYGGRINEKYKSYYGESAATEKGWGILDSFSHFINQKYNLPASTQLTCPTSPHVVSPIPACFRKAAYINTTYGLLSYPSSGTIYRDCMGNPLYYGSIRCITCFPPCNNVILVPLITPQLITIPEPDFQLQMTIPKPNMLPVDPTTTEFTFFDPSPHSHSHGLFVPVHHLVPSHQGPPPASIPVHAHGQGLTPTISVIKDNHSVVDSAETDIIDPVSEVTPKCYTNISPPLPNPRRRTNSPLPGPICKMKPGQ